MGRGGRELGARSELFCTYSSRMQSFISIRVARTIADQTPDIRVRACKMVWAGRRRFMSTPYVQYTPALIRERERESQLVSQKSSLRQRLGLIIFGRRSRLQLMNERAGQEGERANNLRSLPAGKTAAGLTWIRREHKYYWALVETREEVPLRPFIELAKLEHCGGRRSAI